MRLPSLRVLTAATLTLSLGISGTVQLSAQAVPAASVTNVATLQPIRLAVAITAARPGTIANDRGIEEPRVCLSESWCRGLLRAGLENQHWHD